MITPATPSAATASSMPSQAMPKRAPSHAPVMPRMTTNVLHTSVEKCSASASRASLGYFCGHAIQSARADEINSHAQRENQDRQQAGANVHGVEEQPLKRFPDDVHGGEQQQAGFDERGKTFHFPVAVEMIRVGGFVRNAHRKIGDDRGHQIQDGMQRFGQNAQAAGAHREKYLQ